MCVGGGREGGVGMLGIRGIALFLGLLYLGWPGNEGREGDSLLFIRIIIILFIILHNSYSWKAKKSTSSHSLGTCSHLFKNLLLLCDAISNLEYLRFIRLHTSHRTISLDVSGSTFSLNVSKTDLDLERSSVKLLYFTATVTSLVHFSNSPASLGGSRDTGSSFR